MAKTAGGVRSTGNRSVAARAKEKIIQVLSDIRSQGFSRISPFKIGGVERRMQSFANANGITLGSKDVYMSSHSIAHATRDSKAAKGLVVSDKDLSAFPGKRARMDLYYDTRSGNFSYTDGRNKFVVHPNYEMKMPGGKKRIVNFITASRIEDNSEFGMPKYKKIR